MYASRVYSTVANAAAFMPLLKGGRGGAVRYRSGRSGNDSSAGALDTGAATMRAAFQPTGLTERMELDGGEVPVLDSSAAAGRLPAAAARCAGPQ